MPWKRRRKRLRKGRFPWERSWFAEPNCFPVPITDVSTITMLPLTPRPWRFPRRAKGLDPGDCRIAPSTLPWSPVPCAQAPRLTPESPGSFMQPRILVPVRVRVCSASPPILWSVSPFAKAGFYKKSLSLFFPPSFPHCAREGVDLNFLFYETIPPKGLVNKQCQTL